MLGDELKRSGNVRTCNMKKSAIFLVALLSLGCRQEPLANMNFHVHKFDGDKVIELNGDYKWCDGASVYTLHRDHTFSLGPKGISGRVINGWWKHNGEVYVIVGRWSWINGWSRRNDYRMMHLDVRVKYKEEESKWGFHEPYFQVEKLINIDNELYAKWRHVYSTM